MGSSEHNLSLVIKAVDKATPRLRLLNMKMGKLTAPLQNSLGKLSREFGPDKFLGKAFGWLKSTGAAMGRVGSETLKLGAKLAGLGAAAGVGIFSIAHSAVEAGDKLNEMSKRTGFAVDAYAQLQFAAAQADISQENFNGSMDVFNKGLGQAKAGTGRFLAFLNKASPALAKQVRGAKDNEAAFNLMIAAFEKVEDPAKRAALATAAFGDPQFGQFLGQGTKAIEAQRKKFFELAGSKQEFAERSDEADNAIRDSETAFIGLRDAAATELMPAVSELAKELSKLLSGNRKGLSKWAKEAGESLLGWVKGGGLTRLVDGVKSLADSVSSVVKVIGLGDGLRGSAMLLGAYLGGPLISSIGSLGLSFTQLGFTAVPVLNEIAGGFLAWAIPLGVATIALGAVAAAIYQIWKNWDELKVSGFDDVGAWLRDGIGSVIGMEQETDEQAMRRMNKPSAFGAARPVASLPPARTTSTEARVAVDFNNMPKGTKVTPAKGNTAPLDLSMGYGLVLP